MLSGRKLHHCGLGLGILLCEGILYNGLDSGKEGRIILETAFQLVGMYVDVNHLEGHGQMHHAGGITSLHQMLTACGFNGG